MKWLVAAVLLGLTVLARLFANPFIGFGVSGRGLTTFDLIPIPLADLEIRADGGQRVSPEITAFLQGYDLRVLKTEEALDLYNRLIAGGQRVAIRVHSTS